MMKLKRFGNLVNDEVSPLLSELLQSFAQETGQITYTDIYNYKGNTEKNKKLIYHINKWNEYIESGQDDKALKKSDEIRQIVNGQKEFSMTDLPEVKFKTRNPELLTKIVTAIGELGNPGHTFTIVLDPGSESETTFTWDGAGSDYIELDGIKSFSDREQVPQYIADEVDASGVVVKYKGDWRIVSKKTTPYEFWDAKYKTKQDAEDALAAYHANK